MVHKRIFTIIPLIILVMSLFAGQVRAAPPNSLNDTNVQAGALRGIRGDTWADIVVGKPGFGEMGLNEVTGSRVFNPGGVIIDRSVTPNRMYVYDGGNSRVLGLHVGSQSGQRAELVLGQPALDDHSACNGDGNYQNYPQRAAASAATLCSMPEDQVSPREGGSFANMAVDASGDLYVPDFDNHRVLLYISPFTTDTLADDVWGQADFSGNDCNRGADIYNPTSSSLCLRSPFNEGFVGGVGLDSANNLWVTDNQNNRVLRFPCCDINTGRPAHTADLVLGQPDFTTGTNGSAMNKMWAPAAVRVDPATGNVFVADSLNNRILVFVPPFSTGMSASATLGSGLHVPTSIEFDLQNNIWISDSGNSQLLHFTGGVVDHVLFKNAPDYSGSCLGGDIPDGPPFYFPGPKIYQDSANICDSRGSLGIDSGGNIWASGSSFNQDVWRYPAPFPPLGTGTAHSANVQLFKPYTLGELNSVTARGLSDPRGIAIGDGQLIVSDGGRILFWNNAPDSLTNGKPADGVIGAPNFNQPTQPATGPLRVDGQNQLWTTRGDAISVYNLPLTSGAAPFYTLQPPVALKGGGSISWTTGLDVSGMLVTNDDAYLWLTDPNDHRVLRIANPLTNPTVDIVLGQLDANGHLCNQGRGDVDDQQPTADSLCFPGALGMDPNGDIFVSDNALEDHGNNRLLEYDAGLFPASPVGAVFGIPASRVYGTSGSFSLPGCLNTDLDPLCKPLEPAFNQNGQMVVGLNGYSTAHFPLVYQDPLSDPLPVDALKDFYSMPSAATYDASGNLYVADRNRGRVLIYLANTAGSHLISGSAGVGGVTLSYLDGTARTVTTNLAGHYAFYVPDGWSGTVTPSSPGLTFTPSSLAYSNVRANQTAQNYSVTLALTSAAGQDGWVLETGRYSGRGGSRNSIAPTLNLGDDAAQRQYRSILSFATAGLPDNAVITAVSLRIRKQGILGGGNPLRSFGGIIVDVKKGVFGTSAALQAGDFQAAASKSYGPFAPALVSGWYTINLTGAKSYINKLTTWAGLTQLRLRFKLANNNNAVANILSLYSGNASIPANRPQLVITYYVP